MAKQPTYPTLFDDCLQLHISKLKQWGYLDQERIKRGTINWSSSGTPIGSISIEVNMESENPYLELDYKYRGEPRNYKVNLVSTLSNLNAGTIWYFLCPYTKKRCRKLYSIDGYFLHREAFKGCMYKIQTESKRGRQIVQKYKPMYKGREYDQLKAKHFRMFYNGKPTKRFLQIMKKIKTAKALPDPFFDRCTFRPRFK